MTFPRICWSCLKEQGFKVGGFIFWKSNYNYEHVNSVNSYEGQNKLRFIKFVNVTEFEVEFSLWRI
jgi:hypothetical protein